LLEFLKLYILPLPPTSPFLVYKFLAGLEEVSLMVVFNRNRSQVFSSKCGPSAMSASPRSSSLGYIKSMTVWDIVACGKKISFLKNRWPQVNKRYEFRKDATIGKVEKNISIYICSFYIKFQSLPSSLRLSRDNIQFSLVTHKKRRIDWF